MHSYLDIIDFLKSRRSVSAGLLRDPGPDPDQIHQILSTAIHVPDHGKIRPWKFLVLRGQARNDLGDLLVQHLLAGDPTAPEPLIEKERSKPLRAPVLVALIAEIKEHRKVPRIEQIISCALAGQNILLSAHAMGFGAVWLTGSGCYSDHVHQGLGLVPSEELLGWIYLGSYSKDDLPPALPKPDLENHMFFVDRL